MEFPILLQLVRDSELRVVRTEDEWQIDPELHGRRYASEDRLIDSDGVEYGLTLEGSRNAIKPTGRLYTPEGFIAMAGNHIRAAGAEPEWLAAHLKGIAENHKIRATILYLSKLAAADIPEGGSDEEE
jgi:hypothetical protein